MPGGRLPSAHVTTDQIDNDIWRPLIAAYPLLRAAAALSVYSRDLIHGSATVQDYDAYAAEFATSFDVARSRGDRFAVDFRFTSRIVGDGVASERGVFRVDVQPAEGDLRTTFGYFQVFSRVEDGRWRILTDFDEPGASEAEFWAAVPLGA